MRVTELPTAADPLTAPTVAVEESMVAPAITLQSVYAMFRRNRRAQARSTRTIEQYDIAVRSLVDYISIECDTDELSAIDRRLLEDFMISYLSSGRATATANKTFRSLRALFNWLTFEDLVKENPFAKLKPPSARGKIRNGFNNEEVGLMVKYLRSRQSDDGRDGYLACRDEAIMLVLYDTGLRATEVCNMTVEGLDFTSGLFEVRGKGSRINRRHLGQRSLLAIQRYIQWRERRQLEPMAGPLWRAWHGPALTRSGLFRTCQNWAVEVGIKNGGPHRWRYTHAEVLEDLGWPEDLLMAEMGHSVLSVSRTYREAAIRRKALKQHTEMGPGDRLN